MKNINIHKEIAIKAEGKFNSNHCKPVVCFNIKTKELRRFTSVLDAARELQITPSYISTCMGNKIPCKGWLCFDAKDAGSYMNLIMDQYNACISDAAKYNEIRAEQEAARKAEERRIEEERKAKEKHDAAIAKANVKIAKHAENCAKLEAKLLEEERKLMEAETELENLLNEEE